MEGALLLYGIVTQVTPMALVSMASRLILNMTAPVLVECLAWQYQRGRRIAQGAATLMVITGSGGSLTSMVIINI